jgi:CRP-like cAMP-binding protein
MNRLPIATSRIPDTLRRLAYFAGWPDASLANLAAGAKIIPLPKHGVVARKNETLESLYVVVSGLIRLYIPLPNSMERVVSLVGPGESLGDACLILEETCPYDAVASKDSHVLVIDALVFRRELSGDIALTRQTLERMARRYMEALRDTEICAQRSSVSRVASYLLLHRPNEDERGFIFHLPARKQDVAAQLGLSQETFSRVLGFLDKQGVIQMSASRIRVEDISRLSQITSMKDCKEPGHEVANLT